MTVTIVDSRKSASPAINHGDGVAMIFTENLVDQMATIRRLVAKYPYIALDCVWPGNCARTIGDFGSESDFQYQCLRCNVTMSKVLQLSLTLHNAAGECPPAPFTFTFNFHFSPNDDVFVRETYDRLTEAGVPFGELEKRGIKWMAFGQLLITSGLVCMDNVHWIVFNGAWDLGFVMRTMLRRKLDTEAEKYNELLHMFFKNTHDIRMLILNAPNVSDDREVDISSLRFCAAELDIDTSECAPYQTSTDSQLVGRIFFALRLEYEKAGKLGAFNALRNTLFEYRCTPVTPVSAAGNQLASGISALTTNIFNREFSSPSPLTVAGRARSAVMKVADEDNDTEVTTNEQASRPQLAAPGSQRHRVE